MRVSAFTLGLTLLYCTSAVAQDEPRIEVFAGYSYLNIDTNGLADRQSANGWEASVSGNLNRRIALEGSVAGYYKTYPFDFTTFGLGTVDVHVHDYSYLAGPRLNLRPIFIHALVGGDHLRGSANGYSAWQVSFAAAFGGGLQWKVAPQWAVRGSADYGLTRHDIFGNRIDSDTQNNFRASLGVVYLLGGVRESGRSQPRQNRNSVPSCSTASEAVSLGVTGCSLSSGFEVSYVRSGSPAASVGISPGDVITSIDGRAVRDSRELEQAIAANRARGKNALSPPRSTFTPPPIEPRHNAKAHQREANPSKGSAVGSEVITQIGFRLHRGIMRLRAPGSTNQLTQKTYDG